jgi:hypothetical protein
VVVVVEQEQLEPPQRQVKAVKVEMDEPHQLPEAEFSMPVVVVVPVGTQVLPEEPQAQEAVEPAAPTEPVLALAVPMVRPVPVVVEVVVATPIQIGATQVVQVDLELSSFPTVLSWKSPAQQPPLEQEATSLKHFKSPQAMVRLNMTSPSPQLARC